MIIETNLQILDALRQSLDVILIALIYNFNSTKAMKVRASSCLFPKVFKASSMLEK